MATNMNGLVEALARSHLPNYQFRRAAQSGLMVYRNYFIRVEAVLADRLIPLPFSAVC